MSTQPARKHWKSGREVVARAGEAAYAASGSSRILSRLEIVVRVFLAVGTSVSTLLVAQQCDPSPSSSGAKVITDPSGIRIEVVTEPNKPRDPLTLSPPTPEPQELRQPHNWSPEQTNQPASSGISFQVSSIPNATIGVSTATPQPLYPSLSAFGVWNVVPGIEYPDWFGDSRISASDREYLVARFNQREWLQFNDLLETESEPQITMKDGRVLRLQPFLDMLSAFGAALNPDASQVGGNARAGVQIKPRDGFEQDQPSAEETRGDPEIDLIDKELRWFRQKKYQVPPTIGSYAKDPPEKSGYKPCSNATFSPSACFPRMQLPAVVKRGCHHAKIRF